ncbi:carbonic anhydrase [Bifidobacterium sp. 82T24]|uniref:carbonic anhydrase n=1 Tax=Bifidobacterium pluvialisilvae TaxID=2834436 RepID=UPI001C561B63|nr:carbonic anhydrase [Bifidobacterium pluvialisilvae]MBW3088697.1 carbonic anhydrase [Bifidobacterium pluvialisilvae]
MTTQTTWNRLINDNRRFAAGNAEHPHQDRVTRESLVAGQHPKAAVLSCSDSRATPEIVFDQGLGDLFDIRTAGEVVDDAVLESLEYAVEHLHVRLIVVMGHEHCGAVAAAMETLADGNDGADDDSSRSMLMRKVGASVRLAFADDSDATADDVERVHVARTIEEITNGSTTIRDAVRSGEVAIVGARYRLGDGTVEVLPL